MVMKMPTYASMFEELPTTVAKANALVAEVEHELQVKYSSLRVNNVRHDHALITITKENNLLVLLYQFQCTKKQLPVLTSFVYTCINCHLFMKCSRLYQDT